MSPMEWLVVIGFGQLVLMVVIAAILYWRFRK